MVHFLYPAFLYGLFALAIPVILHFFSFKKYKRVYFSNFNFLTSLQQERKNSSKLKNLLLLLLRLVVLAAVVVAFANPYLAPRSEAVESGGGKPNVVVYVDNSFSMTNTGSKGTLLEEAKRQLFDILSSYPDGVPFTLLTNDPQQAVRKSKEEIQMVVSGLKATSRIKKLPELFKEAAEVGNGERTTLFLLSDFQNQMCDFQRLVRDSLVEPVFLLMEPENTSNLYVKEVTFEQAFHRKNTLDRVTVRVANASLKDFNGVPVSVTVNGEKKGLAKVNLPAGGEQTVEISYMNTDNGFYRGCVEVTDFPLVFDNAYYFSYRIADKIRVLSIEQGEHNPYFGKLFADTVLYGYTSVQSGHTAGIDFGAYNLIILNRLNGLWTGLESGLENYVAEGGNVLLLPGTEMSVQTLNPLMQKLYGPQFGGVDTNAVIARVETESALFKDAFEGAVEKGTAYPTARRFYPLQLSPRSEPVLTDKKGNVLLAAYPYGDGNVYVASFSFDEQNSDMVFHPLFVPLMVNMAYNVHANLRVAWNIGSDDRLSVNGRDVTDNAPMRIAASDGSMEFLPEVRKDVSGNLVVQNTENLREAGVYEVYAGETLVDVLACNYDREESVLRYCSLQELQRQFPDSRVENIKTTRFEHNSEIVREIVNEDHNRYLARYFLLLAVLALLAEQWVWCRRLQ